MSKSSVTPVKLEPEQVASAIEQAHGNISVAAQMLNVERFTVYRWVQKSKLVAKALATARERMIDNVESKLYSKALEGEGWAVCFFLKTQAKHRGYVERSELSGPDGESLVIKFVARKND